MALRRRIASIKGAGGIERCGRPGKAIEGVRPAYYRCYCSGDMFSETAPEVKALALFIVANNRSAKRMATAFKLMAQRINDELQHRGRALGDMFGGGDVSLQDILRRYLRNWKTKACKGYPAVFSSPFPAVVTTVLHRIPACYYIGHPASKTLFI